MSLSYVYMLGYSKHTLIGNVYQIFDVPRLIYFLVDLRKHWWKSLTY